MSPALWKTSKATKKIFEMFNVYAAEENLEDEL